MPATQGQLRTLMPYLEGDVPTHANVDGTREWNMFCPLHEDSKRSASLNVDKGEWWCFAGCGGGRITSLLRRREEWLPAGKAGTNGGVPRSSVGSPTEVITGADIAEWHKNLLDGESLLEDIVSLRGVTTDTLIKYEIGYDNAKQVYTIPVYGPSGEIWNVRRYNPRPTDEGRKMWSVRGMGLPRLYPISVLLDKPNYIIIGEGEWDILLTIQNGYPAITRTGAADVWRAEWSELFVGMTIYLAHDMDVKGDHANRQLAAALGKIADVRILSLPYARTEKHGKDLTNFWMEHDRGDFEQLLKTAEPAGAKLLKEKGEKLVSVLESFDAKRLSIPVSMYVTIKGKIDPGYAVPRSARLMCDRKAGAICAICPMNAAGGDDKFLIEPRDPHILAMMDSTTPQVREIVREAYGAQKCKRLTIEVDGHQSVEVLYARPSIDHGEGDGAYKNIRITSVGRHDTMPNNTVKVTGALHPNPRTQANEFLSWGLQKMETSVDKFELTKEAIKVMKTFQVRGPQRPIRRMGEISRELSAHVTRIVGRHQMHMAMDLVFHSIQAFKFGGQMVQRGWLELLVVGDTQQGKSETARGLVRHYGAGEVVSCESASFAGVIGGAQQIGGKAWAVTWGAIPINDRRLVVLEEVSGLSPEEISQMSEVRSSGTAKITKIATEVTFARTRLIWIGNPRQTRMSDYTYGVDAIRPLIGNAEDIARFDMAMSVALGEVSADDINQPRSVGELKYPAGACHTLLMWCWTRQPDQVVWAPGAEEIVYSVAKEMGKRYVEEPPLVQAANIRIKIARMSVALAARLFSTDETHERVVVRPEHVEDAVAFLDHIYSMEGFGYAERSREIIEDTNEAKRQSKKMQAYLDMHSGLSKFLRGTSRFRRQDIEEVLNFDREGANAVINTLWDSRMIRKDTGDRWRVEPTFHELLREAK